MHISVRRYRLRSSAEEVARKVEQGFVPLVSKEPGFQAYYVMDAGAGTLMTLSVFADRAGAEESNRIAADWAGRHLDALASLEETAAGEVTVHAGL
jgi:hypothetical protein